MKAFLMAAGKGTRLKPYTDVHPKCLIPIHGTPLLKIWIDLLASHGVTEILINTHHHSDQVEQFVSEIRPHIQSIVQTVHEPKLLGSAGTVWNNRDFVGDQDDFLIAYSDNLTNLDLSEMVTVHRRSNRERTILTMALMNAPDPKACGIATLDNDKNIISFVEKPDNPKSDLANAGIYIASKEIYEVMQGKRGHLADVGQVWDLGHHVLPLLTGRMRGFHITPYYLKDIGTPEAYQEALGQWPTVDQNG